MRASKDKSVHVWKAKWIDSGVPKEEQDRNEAWDMAGRDPNQEIDTEAIEAAKTAREAVKKAKKEVKKAVKKAKSAAQGKKEVKVVKKEIKKVEKKTKK